MKKLYTLIAILSFSFTLLVLGITLFFKFNSYQITFVVDNQVYETLENRKHSSLKELPAPQKEGYTFMGWYDEENNVLETEYVFESDSVYFARWEKIDDKKNN